MSVLEAGMMVCFGASWPIAAYKTFKAKRVDGKSFRFSLLILLGYILGITHKLLFNLDWVIYLYILNFIFVFLDACLYLRYRKNSNN